MKYQNLDLLFTLTLIIFLINHALGGEIVHGDIPVQ